LTCIKTGQADLGQSGNVETAITLDPKLAAIPSAVRGKNNLRSARLAREWKTMSAMVSIYCRDHHERFRGLCAECRQFLDYAQVRLERCRFGEAKPTCANCPVHCYQRERREQARVMMRYAGPRMLWEHPLLSLHHWLDGFRAAPAQG
jgi:hypothetical protein